jgi:hypothetical protein
MGLLIVGTNDLELVTLVLLIGGTNEPLVPLTVGTNDLVLLVVLLVGTDGGLIVVLLSY